MVQADPTFGARGGGIRSFKIEEITDKGFAMGSDNFRQARKIPMGLLPAKSPAPQVGEVWIITKQYGLWAFSAISHNPDPPIVTGQMAAGTVLNELVTDLGTTGYIENSTTQISGSADPSITIGTTVGSPTTGTWGAGQQYLDTDGIFWFCTVSGTPGTWIQGTTPITTILEAIYPIGIIVKLTVSDNPAVLFGFGTWVAFAEGQTIIGAGTSDAIYTAGATGGASSQTIYPQYLPNASPWSVIASQSSHSHGAYQAGHNHSGGSAGQIVQSGGGMGAGITIQYPGGSYVLGTTDTTAPAITVNPTTPSISVTVNSNWAGGGTALPTVPPYVVAYIWQRTA